MEFEKVKFGDIVKEAVSNRNEYKCHRIAERLWYKHGLNYEDTFKFVHRLTGIELPEWEALLRGGG